MKLGRQKLLGSLRGKGELRLAARTFPVRYELDRFSDRQGERASGSVTGDLSELSAMSDGAHALLVLEDGSELTLLISDTSREGADVEVVIPAER